MWAGSTSIWLTDYKPLLAKQNTEPTMKVMKVMMTTTSTEEHQNTSTHCMRMLGHKAPSLHALQELAEVHIEHLGREVE